MRPFGKADREEDAPGRSPSAAGPPVRVLGNPSAKREQAAAGPVMSASLRERIIEQIEPSVAATVPREVLRRQIEEIIHQIANQERLELSAREQLQLADELADDMTGYGPLASAPDRRHDQRRHGQRTNNIYVERSGKLERVACASATTTTSPSVAQKIASRVGRRVDESSPMVDCRLPDGSRVNIILPPLALHSPCISIRKFPERR